MYNTWWMHRMTVKSFMRSVTVLLLLEDHRTMWMSTGDDFIVIYFNESTRKQTHGKHNAMSGWNSHQLTFGIKRRRYSHQVVVVLTSEIKSHSANTVIIYIMVMFHEDLYRGISRVFYPNAGWLAGNFMIHWWSVLKIILTPSLYNLVKVWSLILES